MTESQTKKVTAASASKAFVKSFTEGFGVTVESPVKSNVLTITEIGDKPKGSTESLRTNWLRRRARAHGFEPTGKHNEFKFVGVPESEDETTE